MSGGDFWERVRLGFEAAIAAGPQEREAALSRACGGDARVRAEVRSLLESDASAGEFLCRPVAGALEGPAAAAGARFGPYEIEAEIGAGGMGVVYRARRADGAYEQEVVVKLLRGHALDRGLRRRFERERQVLASLRHPNIARLLDGGVGEGGEPFLVMEYVRGVDILAHCDAMGLGVAARLELFEAVCAAVQHAHSRLVVHRDLKPAHVVIDEDGRPKLLDFGVAAMLSGEGGETLTIERRLTPQYASPEQVRGEPVTTATDVYALGLILYELLSGRRPYTVRHGASDEERRLICEAQPPSPSRLLESREGAGAIAAARGTTARRLRRLLSGDLDTIVLTALRKEPERRYASAEALREDLRRYREGLPIAARPDTWGYRAARFAGRHRAAVAAGALAAAALVAATAVSAGFAVESARQARVANAVVDFLRDDLLAYADPHEEPDRDIRLRTVLDRAAGSVGARFADEPRVHAALRSTLGAAYLGLGEAGEALRHHEAALAARVESLGPRHAETLRAQSAVVGALIEAGEFERAGEIVPGLLAAARRRLGEADPLTLRTLKHEALVFDGLGEFGSAIASMARAAGAHERSLGANDPATLTVRNDMALMLVDAGRHDEAEPIVRGVLETRLERLGRGHPDTLLSLGSLGYLLSDRGRHGEAEAVLEEAVAVARETLGDGHPRTAAYLYLLAGALHGQERLAEALAVSGEALAARRARLGDTHPETLMSLSLQGSLLQDLGRSDEALGLLVERHALGVAAQGRDHPSTLIAANNVANALLEMGRPGEAEPVAAETVRLAKEGLPRGYWLVGAFQTNHGRALLELGRVAEAGETLREAEALLAAALGEDHERVARVRALLAELD